jgi:hypothetical protein
MKRKLLGLAGSGALAASMLTALAAPASASPCSGSRIDTMSISGGYVAVYYNSSTGRNCALTYTNDPGHTQYIRITLSAQGGASQTDSGYYRYYAGPVSVYARHTCISYTGNVGGGPAEGTTWTHCG